MSTSFFENIRRLTQSLPARSFVYDTRLSRKDALLHLKEERCRYPEPEPDFQEQLLDCLFAKDRRYGR
jgi:hypothetical protein